MLDRLFGGDTFVASTRALDAYALRHQAISNNLANINTPGYKRQTVRFEDQLAGALCRKIVARAAGLKSVSDIQPTIAPSATPVNAPTATISTSKPNTLISPSMTCASSTCRSRSPAISTV